MKNLIIVAHPVYEKSVVTKAIIEKLAVQTKNTKIHVIDSKGKFNIPKEQKLLLKHEVIIFAFPFWSYSMPWNLKKYFDEVFSDGFAFDFQSDNLDAFKLRHKHFSYIVTVGGRFQDYGSHGKNMVKVHDYLKSIEGVAHFVTSCWAANMPSKSRSEYFIEPFVLFDTHNQGALQIDTLVQDFIGRVDAI